MIVEGTPRRFRFLLPPCRRENLGLALHPWLRTGPFFHQLVEMADRIVGPAERSSAVDRTEKRGRVASRLSYGCFRQGEGVLGPIMPAQGFDRLNVDFRGSTLGESRIIIPEARLYLSEFHADAGSLDERELVSRFRLEEGIEIGKRWNQFSFSRESFS